MIEVGPVLKTWALEREPGSAAAIDAKALPDHRLAYLDYEGTVSGGRGEVARWDQGTYRFEHETPLQLVVTMEGEKLLGRVTIERADDASERWMFQWEHAAGTENSLP